MVNKSRKNIHKKRKYYKKIMRGGDFTQQQKVILSNTGFSQEQLITLEQLGITYEEVNQKINQLMGDDFHGNSDDISEAVVNDFLNENPPNHLDDNDSNDSLHLSDLDNSSENSGYTTEEEKTFGGKKRRTMKKRRRTMKKHKRKKIGGKYEIRNDYENSKPIKNIYTTIETNNRSVIQPSSPLEEPISNESISDDEINNLFEGYRQQAGKNKKSRKIKKQKGGICHGNGVGANNYDQNFSIYNTRELELFPYKPSI